MNNSIINNHNQVVSLQAVLDNERLEKSIKPNQQDIIIKKLLEDKNNLEKELIDIKAELAATKKDVESYKNEVMQLRSVIDSEVHGNDKEEDDDRLAKCGDEDTKKALDSKSNLLEISNLLQSMDNERLNIAHLLMEYQRISFFYHF